MKKQMSVYLKILVTCLCLSVVLFSVFSVSVGMNSKPTAETPQNIPYVSDEAPDFFGILMRFEGGGSVYLGFDKADNKTTVIMLGNAAGGGEVSEYGYYTDCEADASFDFLARFIDNFGGIELNTDEGVFKYTGVQITEMLSKTNDMDFKKRIASKLLSAMRQKGLERADLLMLIEQTETDLNFPSVYHLHNTVNSALGSITFVN